MYSCEDSVMYTHTLPTSIDPTTTVLVDEGDYFAFEQHNQVSALTSSYKLILVTGSPLPTEGSLESSHIASIPKLKTTMFTP